jgi:two-component system sensor histidine kinase MprB
VTLRLRLTLIIGAVVVLAVAMASSAAYFSAARRLTDEVDSSVLDRIHQLSGRTSPDDHGGPGGPSHDADDLKGFTLPQYRGGNLAELDTITQFVDTQGTATATVGLAVALPVVASDMQATTRGNTVIRTVDVSGTRYRVATAPNGTGAVQVARSLRETDAVLGSLRLQFLVIGTVGTAAAALTVWIVARQASRPIEVLAERAQHVAKTQDLTTALDVSAPGEVGQLATSFTAMLSALATSKQQQQRLVQDASHELRTPLTSLRTNIDVLSMIDRLPPEDRAALVGDLRTEVVELSGLVEELVELATDHRRAEELSPTHLGEVATDVAARAERRRGHPVSVTVVGNDLVTVRPAQLDRAVHNVVDNALKFSDGPVEVTVNGGRLEVRDHGPGIAEGDLPRVFDRFYRADATRTTPGSGLGLAIVAQFAEDHGGWVFARNASDGGAVVGFTVPNLA